MNTNLNFSSYLAQFVLIWEIFETKVVENLKTHVLNSSFPENRAVYEIMWKNMVKPDRLQMTM